MTFSINPFRTHNSAAGSRSVNHAQGSASSQLDGHVALAQSHPTRFTGQTRHALAKCWGCLRGTDINNPISLIEKRSQQRIAYNASLENMDYARRPPTLIAENQKNWIKELTYFAKNNLGESSESLLKGMAYAAELNDTRAFRALWTKTSDQTLRSALQQDQQHEHIANVICYSAMHNMDQLLGVISRIPDHLLASMLAQRETTLTLLNSLATRETPETLSRIIPLIPETALEAYVSLDHDQAESLPHLLKKLDTAVVLEKLKLPMPAIETALQKFMLRLKPILAPKQDYRDQLFQQAVRRYWQPNTVQTIIEAGVQLDAQDDNGRTALIVASKYRHDYAGSMYDNIWVKTLLDLGASTELRDNDGRSAMDYARDDAWTETDIDANHNRLMVDYEGHPSAQKYLQLHIALKALREKLTQNEYYDFTAHFTGNTKPNIKEIMDSSIYQSVKDRGDWQDFLVRLLLNKDGAINTTTPKTGEKPLLSNTPISAPNNHALKANLDLDLIAKIAEFWI